MYKYIHLNAQSLITSRLRSPPPPDGPRSSASSHKHLSVRGPRDALVGSPDYPLIHVYLQSTGARARVRRAQLRQCFDESVRRSFSSSPPPFPPLLRSSSHSRISRIRRYGSPCSLVDVDLEFTDRRPIHRSSVIAGGRATVSNFHSPLETLPKIRFSVFFRATGRAAPPRSWRRRSCPSLSGGSADPLPLSVPDASPPTDPGCARLGWLWSRNN